MVTGLYNQELKVGDVIAWDSRSSGISWIETGKIVSIEPNKNWYGREDFKVVLLRHYPESTKFVYDRTTRSGWNVKVPPYYKKIRIFRYYTAITLNEQQQKDMGIYDLYKDK